MSINKLSHLTEWEKIYLEVERTISNYDDDVGLEFSTKYDNIEVSDDDTFYTLDDLKQLANDGMPKQGELEFWDRVSVSLDWNDWYGIWFRFVWIVKWKYLVCSSEKWIDMFNKWCYIESIRPYDYCEKVIQKTELTLAEVEEKLGMEKGSLIIKD